MKNNFTSRGYTYELIKTPRDFASLYFQNCDSLTDERLLEFLIAECRPKKGLFKVKSSAPQEHFFFWFEEFTTEDEMMYVCLDSIDTVATDEDELRVIDMYDWAIDLKDNFKEILND
tara:strand:+ start:599 stop:949 length:351 start_codon:yes stop_codon:yes gene_type:complete